MNPDAEVAEALPRLYRRVLDAAARLEQLDARRDAARLRRSAIDVYGGPWNAKTQHRLEGILARLEAAASEQERRPLRVA